MVNGPLKIGKSRQILPKSRNLAKLSNGSRSLRFCAIGHIYAFLSSHFSASVSDFKMPVSASRRVSGLAFATPKYRYILNDYNFLCFLLVSYWHEQKDLCTLHKLLNNAFGIKTSIYVSPKHVKSRTSSRTLSYKHSYLTALLAYGRLNPNLDDLPKPPFLF